LNTRWCLIVHEEGLLAGQGYAGGHEDAGENELRRPGFYWQEESSPASDERRYTPDWLEEHGMRLLPASDSRHGVQAMDGFCVGDVVDCWRREWLAGTV
jgi:hypothetical protein